MSDAWLFWLGVLASFVVNETCEVSPWCGRRLVRLAARMRYANPERRKIRADELVALIDERPGKLLKLLTGLSFATAAVPAWLRITASRALRSSIRIGHRHVANSATLTVNDPLELPITIERFSTRLTHLSHTGGVLTVRGGWGTGKTTVTNHILAGQQQPMVIHYNPWLEENANSGHHPLSGLAAAIRASRQELNDLAAAIECVVNAQTRKAGPDRLATRQAIRRLTHALRNLPHTVLISLDDLDRIEADHIRDVLTVVASTRSVPHLVWLMAFDPAVVRPQVPKALYTASVGKDHINLAYGTLRRKPHCPTHAECYATYMRTLLMMTNYTAATPPPHVRNKLTYKEEQYEGPHK